MNKKSCPVFVIPFLFFSQVVLAQGMGEYGRLLGGLGPKNSSAPKGVTPGTEVHGSVKQGLGAQDRNPMPPALIVESNEAILYAKSEDWAEKVTQVPRGEKLVPMVQAAGASAVWYMVKTQTGAIGWVKSADVSSYPVKKQ